MERHQRTLDSSMSSLYSGSNVSHTPSRQLDNFNYATMSSSVSPTPSAAAAAAAANAASDLDGAASGSGSLTNQGLRATTIGTVVVRCGPIQLVIALLQSQNKIHIKVVELEPRITTLGNNFDESLVMLKEHDETLRNVQNLPGPMDEFVQKADKLLASKRISTELVNAMADTLNIIWEDILHLLHDRQNILHLCTQFHEKMTQCLRRMDQLEVACIDTMVPIEVPTVQEFLNKFKQLRIDMLTAVMAALKDGNELLALLQDLAKLETLDTRPEHIKRDATRAVHQVQQWLEALHDRRNALELAWQTRKTQLEQCLALALLGRELDELETLLRQQRNAVSGIFSLGECEHTANIALHNYREWKQQALLLRDRALKITRAKEKLQASGTFSGDEACARSYNVLSACTEHLDLIDQREHWLQQSRDFFAKAEHTLTVLEKIEVELSNVKLPPNSPESYAMYSKVSRDLQSFSEDPLRLGYSILDEVGRTQPETQGVKRVLDEIENRKIYIEGICSASNEDQQRVQYALNEFLEQYNDLLSWLMSSGQVYLQEHVDMGRNLSESKQFLLQHHELMQDLEIKGELINLLLESIKTHLESLSPQQRYDVDSKAEALHKHWIELKDLVLKRVDCVSLLIEFFEKANQLASQFDNLDRQLKQMPDQQKLHFLQETWSTIGADYADLKSTGKRFITLKIVDPFLETKSSAAVVEDILSDFSKRQVDVTTSLENWTTHIAEKREIEIILEKIMSDNEATAAKTTKVDTQLYPVFTTTSLDARALHSATSEKLAYVVQDIEKAQHEIQQRIESTLSIRTNDQESLQKIEQVIKNLRTLKSKLDGIKYDYKALLESILQFLEQVVQLRCTIDDHFGKQQQQQPQQQTAANDGSIERIIAEHEQFRNSCMDKFRTLITQSELLIDRVRILEPPGAREIDTDRILKLLENLRIHFETTNSERMSNLERLEKLEQFKGDLCDIHRSLDSVSKQLHEINAQSVDSLAAAKTTSLAFEYFERTIELLEKRIEKFTETTTQQLHITNPESEAYVRDELGKLNTKWRHFKEQVQQKRNALNHASEFFEVVEKIEAEYREISYFYNSVSQKIPFLRDHIEASNLVNDIEKYVGSREGPLLQKLENAAKSSHDMNKVSKLYNEVTTIFQSFTKLKSDINKVQESLKNAERERELREKEAREQAEREKAARDAAAKAQTEREMALRQQAIKEEETRLQAVREQAAREQAAREKAACEEETRLRALREEETRLQILRDQTIREEEERLYALREQTKREEVARLQALRDDAKRQEEANRLQQQQQTKREEDARLQAVRDQIDHQRIVTENIRKDIQVNEIFTEIKYATPRFTRPLKDAITREGDKITFECEVTGNPEPVVEWFKDGISIQGNPDYKTTYDRGVCRLVIEETFTADSAHFTCRAANLVGSADTTGSLLVRENAADVQMVPPRILRFLESGKATEGSSYQFSCTVTGNPLPTVQWYKNDKCIDDSPDYIINYNNGEATLRFEEVFLEDDAVYTCSASNPAGIEHCSASLIVEPLEPTETPHFKIPLSNAMARVGLKIKLEALVGGIPRPDVFWLHNGKPFNPREFKYEYGRVTFIIPQAYPNDAGIYVLTAKNLAGEAYSSCNVIVKGRLPNETSDSEMASDLEPIKPSVQLSLKDVSIFEGKPVRLDCVIVGQPEPEVIWYHDERPVKESTDVQLLFQGDRCSLIIQEVYQEDAGNYKVVAINSAGEASSSCALKVTPLNIAEPAQRSHPERQSLPRDSLPKFEKFLSDVLVDEDETVEMEVIVSGDQPLNAKWYLTNQELIENERISTLSDASNGVFKLILRNVNADDKGVYTVKVTNNAGDAKCFSHLIVKSVNVPDNQRNQQIEIVEKHSCPEFKEFFSDKTAHPDEVIKFECIVKGKPTPKVHWYFNDQPVHGHNFLVSISGERQVLTVQKASPDTVGKISCVAENEVGKATCVAFLTLIGTGLQAFPADSNLQSMTQEHNTESSRVTIKKQTFTTTSTSQVNSYEGNMPQTEMHHSSAHIDQSLKQFGNQKPEIVESHHYQEMHKSKDMQAPDLHQKSFVLVQSATTSTPAALAGSGILASPTRIRKEIAPRFTTPLTGKIVDQGANVSLEAIYDGFPSPEIRVEKNGEQLFESEHMKIGNKCNRITIDLKDVSVNDAGRYAVTAINTLGQSTSTADVVVKKTIFPPVFGRRLQAQVLKKGEKVIMEVEVTGLPEPTVTWLKDDRPLNEAGISVHRILTQGNSHKLIIEKGQTSDSGKYMVKATNAGGEAKSIADCAILEPSPERMQEVVKTIIYETPSEFKTENLIKEPQSYQTNETDTSAASDLHGLSESKIITEHRCITEATMRLEHKSTYSDLPTLSQQPKTFDNQQQIITNNKEMLDTLAHSKTVSTNTELAKSKTGSTQTPPPVPPKPCQPVFATTVQPQYTPVPVNTDTNNILPPMTTSTTKSNYETTQTSEKKSSSLEYFKKIDSQCDGVKPALLFNIPKKDEADHHMPSLAIKQPPTSSLEEDLKSLNLIPGSPPEICYIPKLDKAAKPPMINERIRQLEETQLLQKEAPQGGVPLLPPAVPVLAMETNKHETIFSKEVKVEYRQPIMRPAANLPAPVHQSKRSPSPKPSAEGLAMAKLWTPTHGSGYESNTSEFEQKPETDEEHKTCNETKREHVIQVQKWPTPTTELSAPLLVKQATKSIPITIEKKTTLDDIQLMPGTPPEICFAPKTEVRRHSMVETMEKTLEQNLQQGPTRVLPLSVPTLTPPPQTAKPAPKQETVFRPPPPVLPNKLGRGEFYESDYESDRWKYSGSESDEASFRPPLTGAQRLKSMDAIGTASTTNALTYPTIKTSGYAADTEEISTYRKMESSTQESHTYFESTSSKTSAQQTEPPKQQQNKASFKSAPQLQQQPPAQLHYTSQNGHDTKECSRRCEYTREEKDYKTTSSVNSNVAHNLPTGPKFQSTPINAAFAQSPLRRTPAEYSDYSSEIDERFRSTSRAYESDSEIKGYRVVFPPTPTPRATIANGHKSPVVVVTPSPMEFEPTLPAVTTFPPPKFEPIKTDIRHDIRTETKEKKQFFKEQQQQSSQHVFKPKPVAAKFIQPPPQQQQAAPSKPTLYYNAIAGTPLHTAKMATETKNFMQMKESSETCERIVNMQQTKRVIHFDNQKDESSTRYSSSPLEPFPYSVSPRQRHQRTHIPPPPTPTKFIPGEFRESDYESEVENAKIAPLWMPIGERGPLRFRHVEPPHPGRACSLPRTYERVLSPMEFDRGPEMPSKIQVDANSLRKTRASSVTVPNKTQSLTRHTSSSNSYNQQQYQTTQEQYYQTKRNEINLRPGSPPKYGYIQAQADTQGKHMGSTFLQKTHQFIDDITSDIHKIKRTTTTLANGGPAPKTEPRVITHAIRPGFKRAPSEGENRPQAYRDESRVSQYGTKCVDPNTGLIYFKYDFGYEFGILFPGEGHKFVSSKWNSSSSTLPKPVATTPSHKLQAGTGRRAFSSAGGDLIIPVQHERSSKPASRDPTPQRKGSNSSLQANVQSGFQSDTETSGRSHSPALSFSGSNRLKKRYSLPNAHNLDINIDRLHVNDALLNLPLIRTVPELPTNVPVNAHLNRDEHLTKAPLFITPLKDIAVVSGQTARFECIVQCHPQPQVTWAKNNFALECSNEHIIEYRNGVCRLTIPQAYPGDAGAYTCAATNGVGAATTSGQLLVSANNREKINY